MTNLAEPRRTSPDTSPGEVVRSLVGTSPPLPPVGAAPARFADASGAPLEGVEKRGGDPARFECVKCFASTTPDDLLCPPCYAATRTGRRLAGLCPTCGGRMTGGKCGWC